MNIFFRRMNALLVCAMVATATPISGMENESAQVVMMEEIVEQEQLPVMWYQKRSVQQFAAATTAFAAYVWAVRMGKIAVPTFIASLFVAKIAQNNTIHHDTKNNLVNENNNVVVHEQKDNKQIITTIEQPADANEMTDAVVVKQQIQPSITTTNPLTEVTRGFKTLKNSLVESMSRIKSKHLI